MQDSKRIYDVLLDKLGAQLPTLQSLTLGLTWTLARTEQGQGLAMSPGFNTRTLPWSGDLTSYPIEQLAGWINSWNPFEATVGMAVINAVINPQSSLMQQAVPVQNHHQANLALFHHFLPLLLGQKVVVIGRYPGMESLPETLDLTVLERQPGPGDLPDVACEYLLPQADWVFISATTIINKTFPRLMELSKQATVVLMGPSVPWLAELGDFGVDYLAGVQVVEPDLLLDTVAEGGGTRIFQQAVRYAVYDFSQRHLQETKSAIAQVAAQRQRLKTSMEDWYTHQGLKNNPYRFELEAVDQQLSLLDSRYKRLWDTQQRVEQLKSKNPTGAVEEVL